MQPIDHTSLSSFHLQHPNITSGARYYLVLIISEWCWSAKVAPPKSIILIWSETGIHIYWLHLGDFEGDEDEDDFDDDFEEDELEEEEFEEDEDFEHFFLLAAFFLLTIFEFFEDMITSSFYFILVEVCVWIRPF